MKLLLPATIAAASLLCGGVVAFAPPSPSFAARRPSTMTRSLGVDPFHFTDLAHQMGSLQDALGSLNLADAMDAVADTASDIVQEPAAADNGWFGFLTVPIRGFLQIIHSVLAATGMGNAWGISIIVLTILIKVFTFPLTKTQLESTNKMQAMQPAIKEIQAKYQSNPEVMNQKIAEFYQTNEINPLAGCLPSLVQIPVFIGLYRAVLDLAKENQLNESFLFLPNLEGPTYGADPATASDWILKGWVDGVPSLGWEDTIAFLILPLVLVISQFLSMELMQPKTDDPAQQQSNVILKILPIMIGWFALNVPAALSVYWITNNIITTASSVWIRNSMKVAPPQTPGGAATVESPPQTIFSPPTTREKPAGFGAPVPTPVNQDDVKPITVMDAEIVEEDNDNDDSMEGESQRMSDSSGGRTKKRKGKKKKRKN